MRHSSRLRCIWGLLAFTWFVATMLGHLEFSLWLVRERPSLTGTFSYKNFVPDILVAAGLALAGWLLLGLRQTRWRSPVIYYWFLWGGSVALVDRYLTFSPNEYAHYFQYALLAVLIAKAIDPDKRRVACFKVIFWTTLAGMADELAQYLWITTAYSEYLDFNDFLVNLLAAAAGTLLYYGFAPARTMKTRSRTEMMVALAISTVLVIGFASGRIAVAPDHPVSPERIVLTNEGHYRLYLQTRPGIYGQFSPAPYRGRYWVLAPATGLLLMLGAAMAFGSLPCATRRVAPIVPGSHPVC